MWYQQRGCILLNLGQFTEKSKKTQKCPKNEMSKNVQNEVKMSKKIQNEHFVQAPLAISIQSKHWVFN